MSQATLDALKSWISLHHSNIVPILAFCTDGAPKEILLVHTYIQGENLESYLKDRSLSHTDKINLGNIVVDDKGGVHIGDYGLEPISKAAKRATYINMSSRYQSPEGLSGIVVAFDRMGTRTDGVHHQIVTGRVPYDGINDYGTLTEAMDQRVLPAVVEELDCPPRVRNLLDLCWRWDPENRPPINKVYGILSGEGFMFREEHRFEVNDLRCVKFSHDSKILAARFDSLVILYDTETWKELR
ncbi:hypothetical protein FRB99_001769 [Tulasnella sp. 403]|nr:hypothetical protein FRB99_001769 [Tulasnella sp. 403]